MIWPAANLWRKHPMREAPALTWSRPPQPPTPRQVLLINPFYPKDPLSSYGKHVLTPSLGLPTIAAATPDGWDVRIWDENLLEKDPPIDTVPEVVGITVHLTFAERAYQLASFYAARGSKIVLGGLHVNARPDEAMAHADAISLGDGYLTWPVILSDIEAGSIEERYEAPFSSPYGQQAWPARDLLPRRSFLTTTSVIATRGCHNRCDFCYLSTEGLSMPCQVREPEDIVREIERDRQPYCVFIDNNLGFDRRYLRGLCAALEPMGIIWSAAVTIDVTDEPDLVRAMARSGCTGVFVGLETLDDKNLKAAGKRSCSPSDYARRVRIFHDHGIQVNGSFVLGFDHDDAGVFDRTIRWIEEQRLECATFQILTPYPGTPLFDQMLSEGRILHQDWSRYDTAHVVFQPRRMSQAQLEEGYRRCCTRLFSHRSIWKRRPQDPRAVPAYLAMSYLYKRSNPLWAFVIARGWTQALWRPLIEFSRLRHRARRVRGDPSCPNVNNGRDAAIERSP